MDIEDTTEIPTIKKLWDKMPHARIGHYLIRAVGLEISERLDHLRDISESLRDINHSLKSLGTSVKRLVETQGPPPTEASEPKR